MIYRAIAILFSIIAVLAWVASGALLNLIAQSADGNSSIEALGRSLGMLAWPAGIAAVCVKLTKERWRAAFWFGLVAGVLGLGMAGTMLNRWEAAKKPGSLQAEWEAQGASVYSGFESGLVESCRTTLGEAVAGAKPADVSKTCEAMRPCLADGYRASSTAVSELKMAWNSGSVPREGEAPELFRIARSCMETAASKSGLQRNSDKPDEQRKPQ